MKTILGLHGFSANKPRLLHDTGVSVIRDGKVLFAINEERLSRVKTDGAFPWRSLAQALERFPTERLDGVACPDGTPLWQLFEIFRWTERARRASGVFMGRYLLDSLVRTMDVRRVLPPALDHLPVRFLEHHLCHAASAALTSPWPSCTVVTIDGMGDYCVGGTVGVLDAGRLRILHRTNGFFSPGIFYMIVTDHLGFKPGRHEGKITGLAGFGDPSRAYPSMEKILWYLPGDLDFRGPPIARAINECSFVKGKKGALNYFKKEWADFTREEIAAAAQKRLVDVMLPFIRDAVALTGYRRLALAGGVFANVALNHRIAELPGINGVYVHPNMGDGGLATGAALWMEREMDGSTAPPNPYSNMYLGPDFCDAEIQLALAEAGLQYSQPADLVGDIAKALDEERIVGHFHGAMEYGPRALGNRSILASARDVTLNNRLNTRLRRTEFMPFAPIIQEEHAKDYLEGWDTSHQASRYMTITYRVTERCRREVPAVVHVDGTARPQVVSKADNERVWRILDAYRQRTGIPVLVNTSFNLHEEPIICSPGDAVRAFRQGAVDVLIIGNKWVEPVSGCSSEA